MTIIHAKDYSHESVSLAPLTAYVVERLPENISLKDLADTVGLSKYALTRIFNRLYGVSPIRWLWAFRTQRAFEIITKYPSVPLKYVAEICGFKTPQHFSRLFRAAFSQSPSSLANALNPKKVREKLELSLDDFIEGFERDTKQSIDLYCERCKDMCVIMAQLKTRP